MSTGELSNSKGGTLSRSNRRRRRDPISSASASEKENNLGDDFACLSLESRKMDRNSSSTLTSSKSKSKSSESESRKKVIAIFKAAAASTSEATFWKKHTQLMECVIDASMMSMSPCSFGKSKSKSKSKTAHAADDGTTGTLLLEEHALDLLNGCRRVLKEAKEASKDMAGTLACLCVGVHGLRAICARTTQITGGGSSSKQQDVAVKLLFHAIVTAEDMTARMDMDSAKVEDDALEMQRAACYSLAAYEALGKLLKLYSVQTQTCSQGSTGAGVVIFTMDPKQENDPFDMAGVFPIPITKTSVEEQVPAGSLSIDLVCSIGIQSTIAASRILTRLSPIMKQTILGTPPPVAEFNGILVESIVLEQKNSAPVIPIAVHLIRRILLPWILFLASHSEQDCTKQVTSHGRDAHRILWDAASSMAQSKEDGDAQECLSLRGNAVAALLLGGGDTGLRQLPSRLRSALMRKHFENACTYAWKAAVSYCQLVAPFTTSSAPCPDPLRRYHEDIGRILDAFAVEDSLAYTEYCAYRAFHVGLTTSSSSACLFAPTIPLQYPHSDCGSDSDMAATVSMSSGNQAFLATFFLSVYVRDRLQKIDHVAAAGEDDTVPADFIRNSQAIMARMRSTVIESDNPAAVANRLRYFSMLSMISLHRVVFDLVERGVSLPLHGSVPVMVQLAAEILVGCVGPLGRIVVIAHSKSMDEIRVRQTWTSLVECFVRGISAFEMLSSKLVSTDEINYTPANYPLERANSAMNDLADTLDRKRGRLKAPKDTAENAAKFLVGIGKRRYERDGGRDAQLPFLLSIQIMTNISRESSVQSIQASKLCTAWTSLAALYKSQELLDEASIATVSALVCHVTEQAASSSSANGGDRQMHLLQYLGSLTKDVIVMGQTLAPSDSDKRKRLVNRLVTMLAQRDRSSFSQKGSTKPCAFSLPIATNTLLEAARDGTTTATSFERNSEMPFSIGGVFHAMFATNSSPLAQDIDTTAELYEKIKILSDAIVALGMILQRSTSMDLADFDASVEDYQYLLRLAVSYARKIVPADDDASYHTIVGTLYVAASVSVLSCQRGVDFQNWSLGRIGFTDSGDDRLELLLALANKLADKSSCSFSHVSDGGGDWQLMLCAVRPAVSLYHLQLSSLRPEGSEQSRINILVHVRNAVETLSEEHESSDFIAASKSCLSFVLLRLCDWLSFQGEKILASQIAAWSTQAVRGNSKEVDSWFEATALSLYTAGGFHSELPQAHDNSPRAASHVTDIEGLACRLRLLLRTATPSAWNSYNSQLSALLGEVDNMLTAHSTQDPAHLVEWSRCTVILGLSDSAEQHGEFELAIAFLRTCYGDSGRIATALASDRRLASRLDFPFWKRAAMATLMVRFTERRVYCLQRIGQLYMRVGDHWKADLYAASAADVAGVNFLAVNRKKTTFSDDISYSRSHPCRSSQEMQIRRGLLYTKGQATALDLVLKEIKCGPKDGTLSLVQFAKWRDELSVNQELEKINDILTVGEILSGGATGVVGGELQTLYADVKKRFDSFVRKPQILSLMASVGSRGSQTFDKLMPEVYFYMKLAEARSYLSSCGINLEAESKVAACCKEIVESSLSPASCRARSFYFLGLIELGNARRTGELELLWQGHSNIDMQPLAALPLTCTEKSREFLLSSLPFLGPASELLTRNVLRCLALVTGPERTNDLTRMSSCVLIHKSIGSASRQRVARGIRGKLDPGDDGVDVDTNGGEDVVNPVEDIFRALDSPSNATGETDAAERFFLDLEVRVPVGWRFVAVALCPSGELLLNSLEKPEKGDKLVSRTVCIFPDKVHDGDLPVHSYDDILKPLDRIIERSQEQLEGMDPQQVNIASSEESRKREWWKNRSALDSELQVLIERVDHDFFGSECARLVLLGGNESLHADSSFETADIHADFACGNLASRFEAATLSDSSVWHFEETAPEQMKVVELKEHLIESGVQTKVLRKMRKAELVDLLSERRLQRENAPRNPPFLDRSQGERATPTCTFLILDENTHRFPFEGMPSLEGKTVCRLPSIPFVLATLVETSAQSELPIPAVNPERTSYIIDPESNLGATKDRIQPFVEALSTKNGWQWKGIAGAAPTSEFVEDSVTAADGLLLFFGHGGGESHFCRSQIEDLISSDGTSGVLRTRNCRSSIILMGCSSGRLVSQNRKRTHCPEQLPIHYEPEGVASSYLSSGAPCVVGTLWDVTDRDIDRFSEVMLEKFFQSHDCPSLPQCVASARDSCKLKSLVGYAPVCYGVPVQLLHTSK